MLLLVSFTKYGVQQQHDTQGPKIWQHPHILLQSACVRAQAAFAGKGNKALDNGVASTAGAFDNILMNGQEVFKFAVRAVPTVRRAVRVLSRPLIYVGDILNAWQAIPCLQSMILQGQPHSADLRCRQLRLALCSPGGLILRGDFKAGCCEAHQWKA